MSDFLQFVDRIPTLPNRKKLTFENDGSVKYATVEYADEPINEGTFLNKANFDVINSRLGFNEITGVYNPQTLNAEYTLDELDESSIINNQIVDIQCKSEIYAPADTISLTKTSTFPSAYSTNSFIELDNGNIMVVGNASNNTTGHFYIMNKDGEIIKSETTLSGGYLDSKAYKMSNGNIIVAGHNNGSNVYGYYGILDQNGNIVKSTDTQLNDRLWVSYFNFYEFENGNILICSYDNNGYGKFQVVDQNGTFVKYFISSQKIYEMNLLSYGDKCLIVGRVSSYASLYFILVDENGITTETIPSDTQFRNYRNVSAIKLQNGNYFVCGGYYQDSSPYTINAMIFDSNFHILKTYTYTFSSHENAYFNCYELSNGNILMLCNFNNLYFITLDAELNQIDMTSRGAIKENTQFLHMINGNIAIFGNDDYYLYYYIIKPNGEIVKSHISLGARFSLYYNKVKELSNGNLIYGSGNNYYIATPSASEVSSTLNGIALDTMLIKDRYYELLYNETLNKFIAEEVRNAN